MVVNIILPTARNIPVSQSLITPLYDVLAEEKHTASVGSVLYIDGDIALVLIYSVRSEDFILVAFYCSSPRSTGCYTYEPAVV